MNDEHISIASRDWRLHAITTTTEPYRSPATGFGHPPGTVVELAGFLVSGDETFAVPVADAAGMFLSLATAASHRGRRITTLLKDLPPAKAIQKNAIPERRVDASREAEYFDALQDLVASVVFTYSSLEALANQLLPPDYRYRRERNDGRYVEEYDRGQVERFLSLDEKLAVVLPQVRAVASPKGTKVWQRFVRLERLRNRLVHLKRDDWRNLNPADAPTSIWSDIVAPDVPGLYKVAVELAAHFTSADQPRWVGRALQQVAQDAA